MKPAGLLNSHSGSLEWLELATMVTRTTAIAGEMAPFPFIKGAANTILLLLDTLQRVKRNKQELLALAENVVSTQVVVKEVVVSRSEPPTGNVRKFCLDFQNYLAALLNDIDELSRKKSRFILKRLVQTGKIQEAINVYRLRADKLRSDLTLQLAIDSALITGEMESTLKATHSVSSHILKTVTVQSQQSRKSGWSLACSNLDNEVRTFTWTDIELLDEVTVPMCRAIGKVKKGKPRERGGVMTYVARVADSNPLKPVRVYSQSREGFEKDLKLLLNLRHPCIAQLCGICLSEKQPSLIFHDSATIPYDRFYEAATTLQKFKVSTKKLEAELLLYHYSKASGIFISSPNSDIMLGSRGQIIFFPRWQPEPRGLSKKQLQSIEIALADRQKSGLLEWEYPMSFDRNFLSFLNQFNFGISAVPPSFTFHDNFLDCMAALRPSMDHQMHEFLRHALLGLLTPPWCWTVSSNPEPQLQLTDNGAIRLALPLDQLPTTCILYICDTFQFWSTIYANIQFFDSPGTIRYPTGLGIYVTLRLLDPSIQLYDTFVVDPAGPPEPQIVYIFIKPHRTEDDFSFTSWLSHDEKGDEPYSREGVKDKLGLDMKVKLAVCTEVFEPDFFIALHKACGFDLKTSEVADFLGVPSFLRFMSKHVSSASDDDGADSEDEKFDDAV